MNSISLPSLGPEQGQGPNGHGSELRRLTEAPGFLNELFAL